ncbi:isochorismatase family protein [Shewanella surugensis]|uniref:Isochorismatase family protein n=1 Tax=Shewanella surugensis TaxID=212020 RepID=A0ABT0LDN5_9GAMM|nr:isochorismatase family protein [Shewanella surugensis]MCL1125442.1 isochorismatase family protein [Shewanella surugensis]
MNKFFETLTSDNAVLTMIDHQVGLLVSCRDQDPHLMTENIKGLCSLARTVGLPTITTASLSDGPNGPIMPEIIDILGDKVIEREGEINAWKNAQFKQAVEATGRKKIIMAGIVTDVCLMFPAISAVEEGYDVYAVVDASGTWNKVVADAAIHRMTQAGVKVATWASVLAELMEDWRSEHGMALGGLLAEHTSYRWVYNNFLHASQK